MGCLCEWNLGEGGCNQEQSVYRFRQWLHFEGPAATTRPHLHLAGPVHSAAGELRRQQPVHGRHRRLHREGPLPPSHTHLAQIHTATGELRWEQQIHSRHRRLHCEGPTACRLLPRHLLAQQCHQQPPVPVMCDLGVGEEVWRCEERGGTGR